MSENRRTYKEYTDDDIIESAKKVSSIAGLLRELGLKTAGGNYYTIKRKLSILNVDTSHWTGQGWNKGERLKNWSDYKKNDHLKPHIIRKRGHICEMCENSTWLNIPIPLELHHKDGNRTNNEENNLELLCPNCHCFTDNYRGKKNV